MFFPATEDYAVPKNPKAITNFVKVHTYLLTVHDKSKGPNAYYTLIQFKLVILIDTS